MFNCLQQYFIKYFKNAMDFLSAEINTFQGFMKQWHGQIGTYCWFQLQNKNHKIFPEIRFV